MQSDSEKFSEKSHRTAMKMFKMSNIDNAASTATHFSDCHPTRQQHLPLLDCCLRTADSRTVFTRVQGLCCGFAQNPANKNILPSTCHKSIKENSNNKRHDSPTNRIHQFIHKTSRTKLSVFLLLVIGIVSLQACSAVPVTPSGQRLLLHTPEYREQRYQRLLAEQRSLVVPTPPHYHHIHHRSAGNEMNMSNCEMLTFTKLMRERTEAYLRTMLLYLDDFAKKTANQTLEKYANEWAKHTFSIDHPLNKSLQELDIVKINNSLAKGTPSDIKLQLTVDELPKTLEKIHTTNAIMTSVFKELEDRYDREIKSGPSWTYKVEFETIKDILNQSRIHTGYQINNFENELNVNIAREQLPDHSELLEKLNKSENALKTTAWTALREQCRLMFHYLHVYQHFAEKLDTSNCKEKLMNTVL